MKRFLFPIIFLCSFSMIAASQESSIDDRLKQSTVGFWDQFPHGDHGIILNPRILSLFTGRTGYTEVSLAYKPSEPVVIEVWDWGFVYEWDNLEYELQTRHILPEWKNFYSTDVPTYTPTEMTFTPDNWNVPQKLMVTAPSADNLTDRVSFEHFYTLLFQIDEVRIASYLWLNIQNAPSETTIVPSTSSIRIEEGGWASFEVKLSKAPANKAHYAAVDIVSNNPHIRFEPNRLYFHPGHPEHEILRPLPLPDPWNVWSAPQTVRIFAEHDSNAENERSTITLGVGTNGDQFVSPNDPGSSLTMPEPSIIASDETISLTVFDDDSISIERGRLILSSRSITIEEGGSERFSVHLDDLPTSKVIVNLSSDNPDVTISPRSLTIYPSNWNVPQSITVSTKLDSDLEDDRSSIFLNSHGGASIGREDISVLVRDNHPTPSTQIWGDIVLSPDEPLPIGEGESDVLFISLSTRPNADVAIDISTDNPILTLSTNSLTFDTLNWKQPRPVAISAADNSDAKTEYASVFITASGGITAQGKKLSVVVIDNDPPPYSEVRSQSLALPSSASKDSATLRVQCKQDSPCPVSLDCSTQDGTVFRGDLPEPIPPWETRSLDMVDIERYTGGFSWSGKGRLGCSLLSTGNISSQIWTRSGNGVLVNNSAVVRSTIRAQGLFQADIESIPSPDSSEESNIRLRCTSPIKACVGTIVNCYDDSGNMYDGHVGTIESLATRHIQTEELAKLIEYRWEGLALSCEIYSSDQFTAQVLTRTGGGGGLVNNSASSSLQR